MDFGLIGQWCKSVCNENDQQFVFEKFFHIGHTQKVSPSCVFPDEILVFKEISQQPQM